MILILLGYRGCGKSSLGRYLADVWQMDFVDTDDQIVKKAKMSIPEIFEKEGEESFRDLESEVLKEALLLDRGIIATGGGIVEREENRKMILKQNSGLYLYEKAEVLYQRIRGDTNRPALTNLDAFQEVKMLLKKRDPLYREAARWVVPTSGYHLQSMESFLKDLLSKETEFFSK